ncbi:hypothetical protein QUF72_06640 [Desulfobacterales bacterium HSG2]|nr:hypothetical protein [Desulfobacterales bacterium HSG2]
MQKLTEIQMKFKGNPISGIISDDCPRTGISSLLIGLQCAYLSPEIRKKIFNLLENSVSDSDNVSNGYPKAEASELTVSVLEDEYGVILQHHLSHVA